MNNTVKYLIMLIGTIASLSVKAQVGIGTINPDPSAQLEVQSNSKGLLVPRMTASQKEGIDNPANGLLVYQTNNTPGFYYYNNGQWQRLASNVEIPTGGAAGGNSILNGSTNPAAGIGNNGDFYINTTTHTIFGPKQNGAWPAEGISMVGSANVTAYNVSSKGTIEIINGANAALSPLSLDLADNAVTSAKIADGSIANADLDKKNIPLSGFAPAEGNVAMGGFKITNLGAPVSNKDAATKKYVDDLFNSGKAGSPTGLSLSLDAAQNLSISGGNSVSLVDLYQSLSLSGTVLSISGPRNSHVDLAALLPSGSGGAVAHDGSLTGTGLAGSPLSIADQGVSLNKIAVIPAGTILGNNTGDEASPQALTLADLKAMLAYTKADIGLDKVDNTADAEKNVLSASRLTTPRKINGEMFDGTADITIADPTKQPVDVDLTALAGLNSTGILVRTGSGTAAARTLEGGNGISITNADGSAGNPALSLSPSGVTAGSYTNANITVDAQGRVIAASNGTAGGGTGSGTDDQTASEVPITPIPGINGAADVQAALTGLKGLIDANSTDLGNKVTSNPAITGGTKTKITYDAKGLVTAGADATTADIAESPNKRYVTDVQLAVINNTSNTNTGDQDAASVPVTPAGALTSSNVQAALEELQAKITTASAGGITAVNHDATLTGNGNSVPLSLADNAVSSVKLADGAVTTAKIGDNAVTSVKIANGAISDAKIAGVSGSKVTGNISGNAANVSGVVAIANGGTGATTAAAARNALLPSQAGNAGKVLQTDGSNVSWVTAPSGGSGGISAVSHDATLTGDGNSTPLGLSDNAVTAAKIAAGTITPDKLSSLGGNGTNGQVLTSNGAGGFAWSAPAAGGGTGDMSKSTYDPANISQQVVGTTAVQTLTNKTLNSPALTGVPTAPTAALGTNTTQVATTAFVAAATAAGTPDATASVKGKIQLAGDLAGTAAAPVIANQAVTPAKLKNITGNGTSGQVLTSDGAGGFSWVAAGGSMPNIASNTILGNNTTGAAAPAGLTPAQVKTLLGLTKTDVGLSNVDNTADAGKSVASAAKLTTPRTINGVAFDGSANITIPSAYALPNASSTVLGGVKVGSGLAIDAGGVLSVSGGGGSNQNLGLGSITASTIPVTITSGTGISLPSATASAAGLLSAADKAKLDGMAAGANNYTLPAATVAALGGVRVGSGLSIDGNGILSASGGMGTVPANTLLGNNTGSAASPAGLTAAQAKTLLALDNVKNIDQTNASNLASGTVPAGRLPIAAASTLGAVRVGPGLAIDGSGILSVAGGGSAPANLALGTVSGTAVPITNSNGTGVTIPAATASAAGVMSNTDKAKLDKIPDVTPADANKVLTVNGTGTAAAWTAPAAGGNSGGYQVYHPGGNTNFFVRATGPGVTCTLVGNKVTVVIPDGVFLNYLKVSTTYAAIGNNSKLLFEITDKSTTNIINTDINNVVMPIVRLVDNVVTTPVVNPVHNTGTSNTLLTIMGYGSGKINFELEGLSSHNQPLGFYVMLNF